MKSFKNPADIKVGVIGYGGSYNMGKTHLDEMSLAGISPKAVVEIDPSRLKAAEKDFPEIETYNSVEKMLNKSNIDLVTIITPHNTHAEIALKCINAGKGVCCEKPLAITTEECDKMIEAAEKNDVLISTYHSRHWDGCIFKAVEEICRKNRIGEVFRIEAHMGKYANPGNWWRSNRKISGGILYDWGVHLLEYSLQVIEGELCEVCGFFKKGFWNTKWNADSNEDEGFLTARFKNGKWLTLNISSIDSFPKSERGLLEITGTEGTYIMHMDKYKIITHNNSEVQTFEGENPESENWRFYKNIANHLTNGEELVISGEWGRRPIHIIDLAVKSAERKSALKSSYA